MPRLNRDDGGIRLRSTPNSPVKDTIQYPHVADDLLRYLNEQFPDRLPPKGTDQRDFDHLTGVRHIIDHLAELANRQKDEDDLPYVLQPT